MELKPNDLPVMELGEIRRVTVGLAGAAGTNAISGTPTASSDTLTCGTASASGLDVSFLLNADQVGTHSVMVEADLTSGETLRGYLRVKVIDSTHLTSTTDYE